MLNRYLVAAGLQPAPLHESEEPDVIIEKIEQLACSLVIALSQGDQDKVCFQMVSRTSANAVVDDVTGAILLSDAVQTRRLHIRNSSSFSRMLELTEAIHRLLLSGKRISQRELFYLLIESFSSQQQLNDNILDVSATLGVPRYALNIGAATRGVLGGCLKVALSGSLNYIDCEFVGAVCYEAMQIAASWVFFRPWM